MAHNLTDLKAGTHSENSPSLKARCCTVPFIKRSSDAKIMNGAQISVFVSGQEGLVSQIAPGCSPTASRAPSRGFLGLRGWDQACNAGADSQLNAGCATCPNGRQPDKTEIEKGLLLLSSVTRSLLPSACHGPLLL